MIVFQIILNLTLLLAVIVLPMAAIWYGAKALGWGFNNHPLITWIVVLFLVCLLVLAGLSFHLLFPNCYIAGFGRRAVCR